MFSNVVNNGVAEENHDLANDISRLRPLRDLLNKMEIRVDNKVISSCEFDSASVDECCHCACGQKVASWDVDHPRRGMLLSSAVREKRGMKVAIAGQCVGDFSHYAPLFMVPSLSPFVCVCQIIAKDSGHSIYVRVTNLSEEDVEFLKDVAEQHPPKDEFLLEDASFEC